MIRFPAPWGNKLTEALIGFPMKLKKDFGIVAAPKASSKPNSNNTSGSKGNKGEKPIAGSLGSVQK